MRSGGVGRKSDDRNRYHDNRRARYTALGRPLTCRRDGRQARRSKHRSPRSNTNCRLRWDFPTPANPTSSTLSVAPPVLRLPALVTATNLRAQLGFESAARVHGHKCLCRSPSSDGTPVATGPTQCRSPASTARRFVAGSTSLRVTRRPPPETKTKGTSPDRQETPLRAHFASQSGAKATQGHQVSAGLGGVPGPGWSPRAPRVPFLI